MKGRRKKLMIIIPVTCVCVAGAGTLGYFKLRNTRPAVQETTPVQSAEAKKGNLSKTIVGTGNLELADAVDLNVPSGLEISEVQVASGDEVKEGDVLAVVDASSILEAMDQIQDEIAQLDKSIQEYKESDEENVIQTSVAGRVKKINVSAGSDIADVMVSDGALMVLSLDGKMAVSLADVSGVSAGDTVTVVLSSGTEVSGTVDSVSGDDCVVTVTDDGTTYGDTVTVTDSSGNELGSGELTIHQPLEITGTSGTVSVVNVSENTSVSEDTTILTLEGNANETEYQELLAKREARTATLKKLIQLKADPEIRAEIAGTVQSVNASAGGSTSGSDSTGSSSTGSSASGSTGASSGKTVSQMSYTMAENSISLMTLDCKSESYRTASSENVNANTYTVKKCSDTAGVEDFSEGAEVSTEDDTPGEVPETSSVILQFAITSGGESTSTNLSVTAPVTGETPVTGINASDGTYTGTVSWNPESGAFAEKTVYQAKVSLTAADGYAFQEDSISQIAVGAVSGISVSQDGKNLTFQITFPETAAAQSNSKEEASNGSGGNGNNNAGEDDALTDGITSDDASGNGTGQNANDTNGISGNTGTNTGGTDKNRTDGTDSNGNSDNGTGTQTGSGNMTGNTSSAGNTTGSTAGNATGNTANTASGTSATGTKDTQNSSDSSSAESTEATSLSASEYSTDVALFTISPDDTMTLNVSVDELDINSVEIGQEAAITFDAIEDKEFTGEVTEIGNTASVSGGVAKYTVSVSVPKDEQMKQGMNASATITIENRENVITIPVNALQEKGDRVFVYTSTDEEGNLSGETEVKTGLSDGTTVEITDGLSEGDTVYYTKTGNVGSNSSTGMPDGNKGDFGGDKSFGGRNGNSDSQNGGPGGNSGGNGGGTPPNM